MYILVADDDKFLASAYNLKLTKAGFEVKVVYDGNELVEALKEKAPDLIVLDLIMPNRDGFSVLEELGCSEEYKSIPVIVASNLGQSEDIVRATKLGARDYIIKTELSMKNLIEKINNLKTS